MTNLNRIDIKESDLLRMDAEFLETLPKDHSSGKNIIWSTNNCEKLGDGYSFCDKINTPGFGCEKNDAIRFISLMKK